MEVHPRHPYAGDLVYTSFSGSHQDAIKKGFDAMEADAAAQGKTVDDIEWAVPYLPIDPKDVGRSYEAVIRVNSQSGKGGIAYVLKNDHKLDLPRRMQIEFSRIIQAKTDAEGGEVTPAQIWAVFQDEYLPNPENPWGRIQLRTGQTTTDTRRHGHADRRGRRGRRGDRPDRHRQRPDLGVLRRAAGHRHRRPAAGLPEHTMSEGASAQAASYIECAIDGKVLWGIGIDANTTRASLKAVVSAVNRAAR